MRSLLLVTTACVFSAPATLHAQAVAELRAATEIAGAPDQRIGRYVEFIVDDQGNGLAAGVFDLPLDPDVLTEVYFPEDIETGDGMPEPYFRVAVEDRKAAIFTRRQRLKKGMRRNVTLSSASISLGLVVKPADTPEQAIAMAIVRKRSEVERREAELAEYAAELARKHDGDATRRATDLALDRFMENATRVRPASVMGDVEPHKAGAPEVTIHDFEGMWWGPNQLLVSFTLENTGEAAFEWGETRAYGQDRDTNHVGATRVQLPAVPGDGIVGRLPGRTRARAAILVERAHELAGPLTILLGDEHGGRPVVATIGNWMPLQTEPPMHTMRMWEMRPVELPDENIGKVTVSALASYGVVWIDNPEAPKTELDETDIKAFGARVSYGLHKRFNFEAEAAYASTGEAEFGALVRSARLGRILLGAALRLGTQRWIPTVRGGAGLQVASYDGVGDGFEVNPLWHLGAGIERRLGPCAVGFGASLVDVIDGQGRSVEGGIHLGCGWKPGKDDD